MASANTILQQDSLFTRDAKIIRQIAANTPVVSSSVPMIGMPSYAALGVGYYGTFQFTLTDDHGVKTNVGPVSVVGVNNYSYTPVEGDDNYILGCDITNIFTSLINGKIASVPKPRPTTVSMPSISGIPMVNTPLIISGAVFENAQTIVRRIYAGTTLVREGDQNTGYTPGTNEVSTIYKVIDTPSNSSGVGVPAPSTQSLACVAFYNVMNSQYIGNNAVFA